MKNYAIPIRHNIEIDPVAADQVVRAGEHWIRITDDVTGVAKELYEIDPRIHLRYNGMQKFYAVYYEDENGDQTLISTWKECDKRIVRRVEQIYHESYDLVADMEKFDKEADAEQARREDEVFGDLGEKLAHAIRKDLELDKNRIFVKESNLGKNS